MSATAGTRKLLQIGKLAARSPQVTTATTITGGNVLKRTAVTRSSGALLPEPTKDSMGLVGFGGTVLLGLTLGATISKHVASFLEENDLFVPVDDDDDD